MKGIILAGASGSRLDPITLGIPKQLIPIYNKPMVYYAIDTLVKAGIKDILVITTSEYLFSFQKSIDNYLNANYSYAIQENAQGIAQAISIAKDFIHSDAFCLITGDTIIEGDKMSQYLEKAFKTAYKSGNATIFVEDKTYPNQYGKVVMDKEGKFIQIVGDEGIKFYYSIASVYIFPNNAVNRVEGLSVSERGLKEITDLNRLFFEEDKLQFRVLDKNCRWFDTNTFDNLLKCAEYMSKKE